MHFHGTDLPAALCDLPGRKMTAKIVGAKKESEVALLNSLTVNIHLTMAAFYKPKGNRTKILIEDHAFPSDRVCFLKSLPLHTKFTFSIQYAMRSILKQNNLDPEEHLIQLKPRKNEELLRPEDILKYIEDNGKEIAVIMLSGVQYYTGNCFRKFSKLKILSLILCRTKV